MTESILEEAQRLIHGERNKNYGHPRENFADISALFSGYLGQEITDIDVANLMILVKVARVKGTGYHRDSFTDIAGYAGCVERIYEEPVDLGEPNTVVWGSDVNAFPDGIRLWGKDAWERGDVDDCWSGEGPDSSGGYAKYGPFTSTPPRPNG